MSNVKGEMKGDLLILTIDCSEKAKEAAPMSSTNKTRTLASTLGFTSFGHGVKVSVNATVERREGDPAIIEKAKK